MGHGVSVFTGRINSWMGRKKQPTRMQRKTPALAGVFLCKMKTELHGRYKIGNDESCILLQQPGHAGCHAGVHLNGTEGIDADPFAGL